MARIQIRDATHGDAAGLSEMAARIFVETFGRGTPPEDLAAHVSSSFSPERQAAEIADPNAFVLVAEAREAAAEPALAGYALVVRSSAPAAVTGPEPIELNRFYVEPAWHGRGVAQPLMAEVLRRARERGAHTVWLGVWEENPRAIAFYRKYGFEHVGEHAFQLGSQRQTDWVMSLSLERTGPPA